MSANAFVNQPNPPTEAELATALGASRVVWDQLLADLAREHGVNVCAWKGYSPKAGWSLRVKRKERTIVWLSPPQGSFTAAFILGDNAVRAARQSRLPQRVVKALKEAPKYAEGTGVRLEVKSSRDLGALRQLAASKLMQWPVR
jgi:hypothetical protein